MTDGLMSQNGLSLILLAGFMLGVVFLLRWIWRRPLPAGALPALSPESGESVVTARPLMTPEEATTDAARRPRRWKIVVVLVLAIEHTANRKA